MNKKQQNLLSFILGNDNKIQKQTQLTQKVNRKLIINSAQFWDSKKRIQKIKTLFLNSLGLKQFDDTNDFKIFQLESIQLLSLNKNHIIHLQPIAQLNTLISLNVCFNKVYDLSPLEKLQKLQELYASHNQIKSIEPLKQLKKLKILQLYKNKIHNFKQTFETINSTLALTELDIEQNPIAQDQQFITLISNSFPHIKKLNGELNKSTQKIKQMSSSKGFMNTSSKGFGNTSMYGTTSMFFTANSSTVNTMDPQKTFYNFCKKKSISSQIYEKRKQKQNILEKLQNHYKQLDEEFEKQIVKNVRLKNRLYKIIQNKRVIQNEKQDNSAKLQQTKMLKRKVKALKQQLFTKDKKGQLLRRLFEIQMTTKSSQSNNQNNKLNNSQKQTQQSQSQIQKLQQAKNQIRWTRKFESDQIIIIQSNNQYLENQIQQINHLLGNIDNSIQQLKQDIDYLS